MSEENLQSTRPTFLTVLCILTFIGSGLGVIGNLLGLAGSAALASFSTGGGAMWSVVGLAASGLCLYGAIQMWGLKKQGFMFYAAGVGISILTSIIVAATFSSAASSAASAFGGGSSAVASTYSAGVWMGTIIGIAINVAFLLMYNANKKHLVN